MVIYPSNRGRHIYGIVLFIMLLISAFLSIFLLSLLEEQAYNDALLQYNNGQYTEALEVFRQLKDYKDSPFYYEMANNCLLYSEGLERLKNKEYPEALNIFLQLGDFSVDEESPNSHDLALEAEYGYAVQLFESGEIEAALSHFERLNDYKDSKLYVSRIISESADDYQKSVKYANAYIAYQSHRFGDALAAFLELGNYNDSAEMAQKCKDGFRMEECASTISAGIQTSLAVKTDHTIVCTGNGTQNFDFSDWEDIVSVSGFGNVAVGLKYDGTVLVTPKSRSSDVSDWTGIVAIATGHDYVVGLRNDGTVLGSGHNGDGQIDVESWKDVISISTSWRRTVGLTSAGTIYMTGYGSNSQLQEIEVAKEKDKTAWLDITAIATGGGHYSAGHTVGLKSDGHVVAVGDNSRGQCNVDSWENVVAIAAGDYHTVGLTADGKVLVAGDSETDEIDEDGTIIGWDHIVSIAAGTGYTLGLREDGTVIAVGFTEQNQLPESQEWTDIMIYDAWAGK